MSAGLDVLPLGSSLCCWHPLRTRLALKRLFRGLVLCKRMGPGLPRACLVEVFFENKNQKPTRKLYGNVMDIQ